MPTADWLKKTLVLVLVLGALAGLAAMTITVSVGPLARWTQEAAACPGADHVDRDVRPGPDVLAHERGSSATPTATTTFELACRSGYEVRLVGNDEAVLKGLAFGFLLGALPCALLVVARRIAGLRTRP